MTRTVPSGGQGHVGAVPSAFDEERDSSLWCFWRQRLVKARRPSARLTGSWVQNGTQSGVEESLSTAAWHGQSSRAVGEDSGGSWALARRLAFLLALDLLLLMESGQWPHEAGTCIIFGLWMTPRSC